MKTLCFSILLLVLTIGMGCPAFSADKKIPVILDTDIGSDIDDTWALALILCSPEMDLKLVVTDSHDTVGKAKIVAKFLEKVGRSDIPIGIGKKMDDNPGPQIAWAKDYDLKQYPGKIHEDGVGAMIDRLNAAKETVTLLVIGPCPNVEEMLKRSPGTAKKARVAAMSGSVKKGYRGTPPPDAEYNVKDAVSASQALYEAPWDLTIAPLDTAGLIVLQGERYKTLLSSKNPIAKTLIENYRAWAEQSKANLDVNARSSTLFDTEAVYLAIDRSLCEMQDVRLKVDEKGFTVPDPKARVVHSAMNWKDLGKYEEWLLRRLAKDVME